MTASALDLLPEYVLGTLEGEELKAVEAALAASPELQREAAAVSEAFAAFGASLAPIAPPPALKQKLLAAITGAERYQPFAAALAKYYHLAVDKMHALITSIDDAATEWTAGPLPGITLMHFDGGPQVAGADCGFVRLDPGLHFPWHRHTGFEMNFVLEGTIRDWDGRIYGPGEAIEKEDGSEHEFWADEKQGALIAVLVYGFDIVPKPE
jgi:anti-sigma factor ChrR (cupin superfamily)